MTNLQLQKNWKTFNDIRNDLEIDNMGRTALLHDGELVAIYNDSGDAYAIGRERFGLGNFTIETFGSEPKSLGFFTAYIHNEQGGA